MSKHDLAKLAVLKKTQSNLITISSTIILCLVHFTWYHLSDGACYLCYRTLISLLKVYVRNNLFSVLYYIITGCDVTKGNQEWNCGKSLLYPEALVL